MGRPHTYILLFNSLDGAGSDGPSGPLRRVQPGKETRPFAPIFIYIQCIILPRQARDKHRESTQKRTVFLQGGDDNVSWSDAHGGRTSHMAQGWKVLMALYARELHAANQVWKCVCL